MKLTNEQIEHVFNTCSDTLKQYINNIIDNALEIGLNITHKRTTHLDCGDYVSCFIIDKNEYHVVFEYNKQIRFYISCEIYGLEKKEV